MIALLNGCGCEEGTDCGCHSHGFLDGVADPAAIAHAAAAAHGVNPGSGLEQDLEAVAAAMPYPMWQGQYIPGTADCKAASGQPGVQPLQIVGMAAGGAGSVAGGLSLVGIASGPFAPITMAIAGIVGLFSSIFNHHAQAVAKEQNVLCAAVPAAANYLEIIETAVANGQASPDQAIQALDSLLSDFTAKVQPIIKMGDQCNAACWKVLELDTAVRAAAEIYSQMPPPAPPQPAPVPEPPQAMTDSQSTSDVVASVVAGPSGTTATQAAAVAAGASSWFNRPSTWMPSLSNGEMAIGAAVAAGVGWRMFR